MDIDVGNFNIKIDLTSPRSVSTGLASIMSAAKMAKLSVAELQKVFEKFKQELKDLNFSDAQIAEIFKQATKNGSSAMETFAKVKLALFGLQTAFQMPKRLFRFTEGIAKLNLELKALSYTASLSMATLTSMGGVLGTFGGGAQDAARSARRYGLQMVHARQGLGFGYLADNAWKYGFGFNFGETQEQRFARIIQRMQSMDAMTRVAFAQDEGLSEAQTATALHYAENGGAAAYTAKQEYYKSNYTEGQEEAAKAGFQLKEATTELSLAWQQFKNEMMTTLGPAVTTLTKWLTSLINLIKGNGIAKFTALTLIVGTAIGSFLAITKTLWTAIAALTRFTFSLNVASAKNAAGVVSKAGWFSSLGGFFKNIPGLLKKIPSAIGGLFGIGSSLLGSKMSVLSGAINQIKNPWMWFASKLGVVGACLTAFIAGLQIGKKIFDMLNPFAERQQQAWTQKYIRDHTYIKPETQLQTAERYEREGFNPQMTKMLLRRGLSLEEIRQKALDAAARIRATVEGTEEQATSIGNFNASRTTNSSTVNNSPTINVTANITGTGDTEQDGKAIADAAAKGIAQFAQSKMSGVKA